MQTRTHTPNWDDDQNEWIFSLDKTFYKLYDEREKESNV